MARVFGHELNRPEYERILLAVQRGRHNKKTGKQISRKSAQKVLQRSGDLKGTVPPTALKLYRQAYNLNGKTFPGVFADQKQDGERRDFLTGTAWDVEKTVRAEIEADTAFVNKELEECRKAAVKRKKNETPCFVTGIIEGSVERVNEGETGETYNPVSGDFKQFTVRLGNEGYNVLYTTHTEII